MHMCHAYSVHSPLSNSLQRKASSQATSRTSTVPECSEFPNSDLWENFPLSDNTVSQMITPVLSVEVNKQGSLVNPMKGTLQQPVTLLCIQWWIPIQWLGLTKRVHMALYCSTTSYLHFSIATNVTPATWWHACSLVQTKHLSHHHLNNCNHTENMEKGRSVTCNLTFPAQKAPSPWQTNVTCNSLWSIRIHNMCHNSPWKNSRH
jgi:hypothetical protein